MLISILLPALSKAREESKRVACSSKLRQIGIAAQFHVGDHGGYYPLVGILPGSYPTDLDDTYSRKYDYTLFENVSYIAPITFALSLEFGHANLNLLSTNTDAAQAKAETDPQGFIKNFLCPSQAGDVSELTQIPLLYVAPAVSYTEAMSYDFNEVVCGWSDKTTMTSPPASGGRLQGRASAVRQPSLTMFACDGLQGYAASLETRYPYLPGTPVPNTGMATLYNSGATTLAPITMANAFTQSGAGDIVNFDRKRHFGKINVGFCDSHVETLNICSHGNVVSSDLVKVFLLAP